MKYTADSPLPPDPENYMESETALPILIVGAGISGLSLAQYLKKSGIPFRIFDRDASIVSRTGGWGLTFHWGLPALKELLPDELYARLGECNVNPNAQDAGKYRFLDLKTGESLYAATFPKTGRLRVIRSKLRTLLATGVDVEVSQPSTLILFLSWLSLVRKCKAY